MHQIAKASGFRLVREPQSIADSIKQAIPEASETDIALISEALIISMTGPERLWALLQSVRYLEANEISGDFVECGVWKGGSSFLMAKALQMLGGADRNLWLFDTFNGVVEPTERDIALDGTSAKVLMERDKDRKKTSDIWAIAPETEVRDNMSRSGYPLRQISFVRGDVKDTLQSETLPPVALARLDTDWYDSTKHELAMIMPSMVSGGVVIVDDYGHFSGSRQAVDEWLREANLKPLLNRIDYTGRLWIMP